MRGTRSSSLPPRHFTTLRARARATSSGKTERLSPARTSTRPRGKIQIPAGAAETVPRYGKLSFAHFLHQVYYIATRKCTRHCERNVPANAPGPHPFVLPSPSVCHVAFRPARRFRRLLQFRQTYRYGPRSLARSLDSTLPQRARARAHLLAEPISASQFYDYDDNLIVRYRAFELPPLSNLIATPLFSNFLLE